METKLLTTNGHLLEQVLEQYSFNRLSEVDTETVEEHVLVCATCQIVLQDIDEYILLMKAAMAETALHEARYPTPSTIDDAAGSVRITADEMTGAIDDVTGRTAAKLDSLAVYVRNHTLRNAFTDVRDLVCRNPGPTLMMATTKARRA